jgi:hypothetical protein
MMMETRPFLSQIENYCKAMMGGGILDERNDRDLDLIHVNWQRTTTSS